MLQQHVINPYILPFGLSWISNVIQLMPIKGISTCKTELNSQCIKPKHWHCFSPLLAPSEGNKGAKNQPGGLCLRTHNEGQKQGGLSLIGKAVEVKNTVMVSMTSCGLH